MAIREVRFILDKDMTSLEGRVNEFLKQKHVSVSDVKVYLEDHAALAMLIIRD